VLIIPAIDIIGGHCVRLTQGDYSQKTTYADTPVDVAQRFFDAGVEWIHVVDLDGAKVGKPINTETIRNIVHSVSCKVEVGGGVRSFESISALLDLGVARVVVGTRIVKDPEWANELFNTFGDQVVAGIDSRDGKVAVSGWLETSTLSALELAQRVEQQGAKRIIVTDIATDGAFTGPNTALLEEISKGVSAPVIASGGVSSMADIEKLMTLSDPGVEGVIVGKAIYEGRLKLEEAIRVGSKS
jgi:phosphoribosylformimino-5-aminoimidazole carboxamide ribotide isomerase